MRAIILTTALSMLPSALQAEMPTGTRSVILHTGEGDAIAVGTVTFEAANETTTYSIAWDDTQFGDYFLSMRPFKCLEGTVKLWCRISYPYEIKREVTKTDRTDLEYDLMFIWKNANDYGIDLWNGVYYRLSEEGDGLTGTMHDIDMNVLASPPDDGNLRPIAEGDLEESDPDSHWLPRLTIE